MKENLTIGALLTEARKNKNISLEDLANKTKININILRSLEHNQLETLPNKTYVKGFVKNCAKTLGINTEEALNALAALYKEVDPEPEIEQEEQTEQASPAEKLQEKSNEARQKEIDEIQENLKGILGELINKKILVGVGALIVAVIAIRGIVGFFSSISQEKEILAKNEAEVQEPAEPIKPKESSLLEMDNAKKIAQSEADSEPEAEAKAEEKITEDDEDKDDQESVAADEEDKEDKEDKEDEEEEQEEPKKAEVEEKQKLPPGKYPHVDFYPAPANMFSLKEDAPENSDDAIFPEKFRDAMDDDKQNVFINATEGDTWLSYQADDEEIKRFVLKKGRTLFIQAEESILLFMGNLNAAKIFYNNQLVEAQSRTGVKSLIFPESRAKDFDLPLFPSYNGVPHKQSEYKENMVEKSEG